MLKNVTLIVIYLLGAIFLLLMFTDGVFAGPNANATVTVDLVTGYPWVDNQIDDGRHSGGSLFVAQDRKLGVEVFAKGVVTSLVGVRIEFDFDSSVLQFDKGENSVFAFAIPDANASAINFAALNPVTLPKSGFIGYAEFTTKVEITFDRELYIGIKSVTLAETAQSYEKIETNAKIHFNKSMTRCVTSKCYESVKIQRISVIDDIEKDTHGMG